MLDKISLQVFSDKLQEKSHFYGAFILFKIIVIKKLGGTESEQTTKGVTYTNFSLVLINENASKLLNHRIKEKSAKGIPHFMVTSGYSCIKSTKLANIIAS